MLSGDEIAAEQNGFPPPLTSATAAPECVRRKREVEARRQRPRTFVEFQYAFLFHDLHTIPVVAARPVVRGERVFVLRLLHVMARAGKHELPAVPSGRGSHTPAPWSSASA